MQLYFIFIYFVVLKVKILSFPNRTPLPIPEFYVCYLLIKKNNTHISILSYITALKKNFTRKKITLNRNFVILLRNYKKFFCYISRY